METQEVKIIYLRASSHDANSSVVGFGNIQASTFIVRLHCCVSRVKIIIINLSICCHGPKIIFKVYKQTNKTGVRNLLKNNNGNSSYFLNLFNIFQKDIDKWQYS